jgi:hypothetical protein
MSGSPIQREEEEEPGPVTADWRQQRAAAGVSEIAAGAGTRGSVHVAKPPVPPLARKANVRTFVGAASLLAIGVALFVMASVVFPNAPPLNKPPQVAY